MRVLSLVCLIIFVLIMSSCSSNQPSEIGFFEISGYKNYISDVDWFKIIRKAKQQDKESAKELFKEVKESSNKLVCITASFKKPIGTTKLKIQQIDTELGNILFEQEMSVNPEMTDIMAYYGFSKKGNFTLLMIKDDIVIAKGDIVIK